MSKDKELVSLSVMLGSSIEFEAKGKQYSMFPIIAAHIEQLMKSNIFLDNKQIYNLIDEKSRITMNKWLGGEVVTAKILDKEISATYFYDENSEPMSLEKTMADGWDVTDYERYLQKLSNLSG